MADPLTELTDIIREVVHDAGVAITPATRFETLRNWDPSDLVAIVVEVECRYDLHFDLPEIDRLVTIGDLLHAIQVKRALATA